MILRRTLFAGLMLTAFASAFSQEAVPGQLIVRFKPTANINAINAKVGATLIRFNAALNMATVKVPSGMSVNTADSAYTSQSGVMYAEPNYIHRATYIPNDPAFASQQYAPQKIGAIAGWDRAQGNANVIIAIIDTGVDSGHPDLAGKMISGFDFVNNDSDPFDDNGHGTHCAGNAAGATNNGIGAAGIAPLCKIMPVKVLNAGGSGAIDWIVSGITYAADNGAKIISLSLGGLNPSQAYKDAGAYALSKGAIPIAAAGNNGTTDKFYPAAWDEYLAVAATDRNDLKAGFSNFGADWVDVAAPGVDIYATFPGGGYGNSSGTSMACPVVAGLAGVIAGVDPTFTPARIRDLIQNGCNPVGGFVRYGRVNMLNSLPLSLFTTPFTMAPVATTTHEGTYASGSNASVLNSDNLFYRVNAVEVLRTGRVASAAVTFNAGNKDVTKVKGMSLTLEAAAVTNVTLSVYVWDRSLNTGNGGWSYMSSAPMTSVDKTATFKVGFNAAKHFDAGKNAKFLLRGVYPNKPNIPAQAFQLKVDKVVATGQISN